MKTNVNVKQRELILGIVMVGFMAALVYVGNYFQIKIPNGVLITRIHLGNSMCLLAGLLFGSMRGGLSSGIGATMYDLFDPVFIVYAPYTFVSKFAMGLTAGFLKQKIRGEKLPVIIAAIAGQLVYVILYLVNTYITTIIIIGGTHEAALAAVGMNLLTSLVNATLAVIIAVPLYFALVKSLRKTPIYSLITTVRH